MDAFTYPPVPHVRRHGPQGYARADGFRPWLRDEFSFRCVYCLLREQWGLVKGTFNIDHFQAVALFPAKALTSHNLLYCCATCNASKSKRRLPNPVQVLIAGNVTVEGDGSIEARTPSARRLIRILGLDDPEYTEFRLLWLGIVALAKQHDTKLYHKLMGYPKELPDLAGLRPPKGNTRPEGLQESHFASKRKGTLPDTY